MIGTSESQFLKIYTKTTRVGHIVDIGTFTSLSAISFAEEALSFGNTNANVDTLGFNDITAKAAQKIFDSCDSKVGKAITLHQGDAVAWMEPLADQENGPTYNFIYIDADKENCVAYYDLAVGENGRRSLFSEISAVLADNSLSALLFDQGDDRRVDLHKFNQHVKNDDKVEQVVLTMRDGITMISRK